MGIFDLFKRIVKTNKDEEIAIEKLAFSEIEAWIENKIKENELKEKEILLVFEGKIRDFITDLREKIVVLRSFDIEARREKDKIKNIVADSREKYIESVEELIERLNNLKELKLENFIEKINKILIGFNKSSHKNYERATILIGKEMADIKQTIKAFSKDLLKTYEKNKGIIAFFKIISQIKSKYQDIDTIEDTLNRIIEKKTPFDKKRSEKEEEIKNFKQKIEETKKSQDYLDFLKGKDKIESLKTELKKDILELKQLIDFKALANFFHINPDQMKILKEHKEGFYTLFMKDDGKAIISFLDESKLNNDKIIEKIKKVHSKLEEIKKHEKERKKDETQELYPKIKEMELEIDNLKIEKAKEEKRYEKLEANKEELIEILKQGLTKLNVECVF